MKKYKNSLCLGKFMPLHMGHIHLVLTALEQSETVHFMVCTRESEPINGLLRYGWAMQVFKKYPDIKVIHCADDNPQYPEEHEDFWNIWYNSVYSRIDTLDAVFASEEYVFPFAEKLGVEPVLVDLDRSTILISATQIRDNPFEHWDYIPDPVKPYYARKIAVVGAESSGKTTLVKELAEHFKSPYLREYGREYTEYEVNMIELTQQDFNHIAIIHNIMLRSAMRYNTNKYLFIDTEAIVTKIFLEMYSRKLSWDSDYSSIEKIIHEQIDVIDLYLLLYPDLEWEDDGSRQPEDAVYRLDNFNKIEAELIKHGVKYSVIKGVNRLEQAIKIVNEGYEK